ncbi:MAG: hypothetical protein U0168_14115 [Nannocystaceae bacterium]
MTTERTVFAPPAAPAQTVIAPAPTPATAPPGGLGPVAMHFDDESGAHTLIASPRSGATVSPRPADAPDPVDRTTIAPAADDRRAPPPRPEPTMFLGAGAPPPPSDRTMMAPAPGDVAPVDRTMMAPAPVDRTMLATVDASAVLAMAGLPAPAVPPPMPSAPSSMPAAASSMPAAASSMPSAASSMPRPRARRSA